MKGNDGTGNVIERDDWQTPQWLFDKLDQQFSFDIDCCATKENSKCPISSDDFERIGPMTVSTCWMNPPFSKANDMFKHFFKVVKRGVAIYRCDNMETKIWQEILRHATWVFLPDGRIHYEGKAGNGARFPSALIGFNVPVPNGLDGHTLIVHNTSEVKNG